jgi:hypothetical protein
LLFRAGSRRAGPVGSTKKSNPALFHVTLVVHATTVPALVYLAIPAPRAQLSRSQCDAPNSSIYRHDNEVTQAMLTKVMQLQLGDEAAELLHHKRAQALFKEIEAYYKRVLEETPGAIPGWIL